MTSIATSVATLVWMQGCLAPPIEPEPEELNVAPYLDFPSPDQRIFTFDSPTPQDFSILAFDVNSLDETLEFVWIGDELGFVVNRRVSRDPSVELQSGVYHQFQPITQLIDPCDDDLQDVTRETLWVYVTDGEFLSVGDTTTLEVEEGRFIASFSWAIHIQPDACRDD